jgi:hypothetical protein
MLEQKADDTMLKFMKDLQEVRRRWTAAPRDARPTPRPDRGRVPLFVMGTSLIVGFSPDRALRTRVAAFQPSLHAPPVPA